MTLKAKIWAKTKQKYVIACLCMCAHLKFLQMIIACRQRWSEHGVCGLLEVGVLLQQCS